MKDLFEEQDLLPEEVKLTVDIFNYELENTDTDSYVLCKDLIKNLENFGYICDYDLDGLPYNLRKI